MYGVIVGGKIAYSYIHNAIHLYFSLIFFLHQLVPGCFEFRCLFSFFSSHQKQPKKGRLKTMSMKICLHLAKLCVCIICIFGDFSWLRCEHKLKENPHNTFVRRYKILFFWLLCHFASLLHYPYYRQSSLLLPVYIVVAAAIWNENWKKRTVDIAYIFARAHTKSLLSPMCLTKLRFSLLFCLFPILLLFFLSLTLDFFRAFLVPS